MISKARLNMQVMSMENLLINIKKAYSKDKVDVEYVKNILCEYQSDEKDWSQYCLFEKSCYTRNLIDSGNEKYNVMILCWDKSTESCIHSHSGAHCFVKVLQGEIEESIFGWPMEKQDMCIPSKQTEKNENFDPSKLKMLMNTKLCTNNIAYINDDIGIHSMKNASDDKYVTTLHIYSPPFQQCHTFDPVIGKCKLVSMNFNSMHRDLCNHNNQAH
ncbi:hypothetical protein A3Q56_00596 [Intoshia linei]|uniref:Cysteine dioxygenase n=1 Tax=Intoshia linei TaxID=1819745 RepID=A0A177BDA2_9BILA|nr:hypothetical protein A3Q56_00596 [Intoshia linei]